MDVYMYQTSASKTINRQQTALENNQTVLYIISSQQWIQLLRSRQNFIYWSMCVRASMHVHMNICFRLHDSLVTDFKPGVEAKDCLWNKTGKTLGKCK